MTSRTTAAVGLGHRLLQADYQAGLYHLLRFNPALSVHELRTRMRGYRIFWMLFAYTGIACAAFLLALYFMAWQAHLNPNAAGLRESDLGRRVLAVVSHTQLTLILLIVPAYSAGAITMEREKRTLEMLRATLLSSSDVVTGKLVVVLALGVVLLLTSLPVAAWCLLLGGVAPVEIFWVYSYLFAICLFVAALGLCLSTLLRRSIGAIVATYAVLIGLFLVCPIIFAIIESAARSNPMTSRFSGVGAAIVLGAAGALAAVLLFLAIHWLWRRLLNDRLASARWAIAVLLPLALFVCVVEPYGLLYRSLAHAPLAWLIIAQPYLALSGVMDGIAAQLISFGGPSPARAGATGLQFVFWILSGGAASFLAICLWAASVRTFRARI